MRRIIVSLMFALLLLCSVVGLKNIATQGALDGTPVVLASGGAPPPIPRDGGGN
ncbi:MAG: hypothetical protein IH847_02385 [Acidobacteria bacterium]|nr:hypothetical protein [Acidobacteriota bacterium]